jgi:hypothetical protein
MMLHELRGRKLDAGCLYSSHAVLTYWHVCRARVLSGVHGLKNRTVYRLWTWHVMDVILALLSCYLHCRSQARCFL